MEKYFTIQIDSNGDEWWYIQGQDGKWYRSLLMAHEPIIDNKMFWFGFDGGDGAVMKRSKVMRCSLRHLDDDSRCEREANFNIITDTQHIYSCVDHLASLILIEIGNKPGEAVNVIRLHN